MKKITVLIFGTVLFSILSPTVFANTPPKLTNGGAQPSFVTIGTPVVHRVTYTDEDGDLPGYVRVHFPMLGAGVAKEMMKISGNYKTGAVYEYSWAPDVSLEYYFETSDGKTIAKLPTYEGGTLAPTDVISEMSDDNKIYLFSKDSNQPIWSYNTGADWVHAVAMSSDGNYITARTSDYIYLFSRDSNKPMWKYLCVPETGKNKEAKAGGVAISKDGKYIVGGCPNSLNLFSKESNNPIWSYQTQNTNLYAVDISSDGNDIVGGTMGSSEIILFSKNSNNPLWKFKGEGDMHGLAISSDGNYIAGGAHCPDRRALLFSRQNNDPLVSYIASKNSPVWTADISSDGKYAAYGLDGGKGEFNNFFIFSSDKKEPLRTYAVPGWVRSVSMSGDGKYVATGSGIGYSVYLFDRDTDKPLWKYKTGERVGSVSISSNGKYIVAGSKDKNIYLFSKESAKPLWNYKAGYWVNAVAISSDGNYVAVGTGASQYLSEGSNAPATDEKAGKPAATGGETGRPTVCGDTICEREKGETYESCPRDCVSGGFIGTKKNQADKAVTSEFKKEGGEERVEKTTTKEPERKSGEIQKHVFRKTWDMFLGFFRKFL